MTEYGVTEDGFNGKDFNVLQAEIEARARVVFGAPNLDIRDPGGMLASIYQPMIERLEHLWELGAAIYNAPDPRRSTGQAYAAVGALRGVTRKPAERGTHEGLSLTFDAAVAGTIDRGAIRAHVDGQPENIWINSEDFLIGGAGTFLVPCESELPGSTKVLNAGATIEILDGPSQLTGIGVPSDGVDGTDLEEESTWRARSEAAIDAEQTRVGSQVEEVQGVVSARVIESPGFLRAIVHDNAGAADDDQIAQAIMDAKCQGVIALGNLSGTALNEQGEQVTVAFDRVTSTELFASVTVKSVNGVSAAGVKAAIIAAGPVVPGEHVIWSKLFSEVTDVEGVDDTVALFIGESASPTGTGNILAGIDVRYHFPEVNIDVTVV